MTVSGSDSTQRVATGRAMRKIHTTKNTVRQNASTPTPHNAAIRQASMMVSAKTPTARRTRDLLGNAVEETPSAHPIDSRF